MFLSKLFSRLFNKRDRSPQCSEKSGRCYSVINSVSSDDPKGSLEFDGTQTAIIPNVGASTTCTSLPVARPRPYAIYDGGYDSAKIRGVCLRIANGGAGQTGFIGAWANAFIQYMVAQGELPFEVAWYLGDTTESLAMLASGTVDVALTYNPAAEKQSMDSGAAIERVYAFRDHFILVGPTSNPAHLVHDDDIFTMFNKIVASGNRDVMSPPDLDSRPATRFLSRFDKSATNIKESQIFITIGQVPWALDCSKWYHEYPRFPREALQAASLLSEYTLTDQGSWLSAHSSIKSRLTVFKTSSDQLNDPLLNPAHLLYGSRASAVHAGVCRAFMQWAVAPSGGQTVVGTFSKNGQLLYSKAPNIHNCLTLE